MLSGILFGTIPSGSSGIRDFSFFFSVPPLPTPIPELQPLGLGSLEC